MTIRTDQQPTLVCVDDHIRQRTLCQDVLSPCKTTSEHPKNLTRLEDRPVWKEEEKPLEHSEYPFRILRAVHDSFKVPRDDFGRCEISVENILKREDGTHSQGSSRARTLMEHPRTWPFMSLDLVSDPKKIHAVRDDLESFYWVVVYLGFVHLRHTSPWPQSELLQRIFYTYWFPEDDGLARGGIGKCALFDGAFVGYHVRDFKFSDCPPLTKFVKAVARELCSWKHETITQTLECEDPDPAWLADPLKKRHEHLQHFFEAALKAPGWSTDGMPMVDNHIVADGLPNTDLRVSTLKRSVADEPEDNDESRLRRSDKKSKQSHSLPPATSV